MRWASIYGFINGTSIYKNWKTILAPYFTCVKLNAHNPWKNFKILRKAIWRVSVRNIIYFINVSVSFKVVAGSKQKPEKTIKCFRPQFSLLHTPDPPFPLPFHDWNDFRFHIASIFFSVKIFYSIFFSPIFWYTKMTTFQFSNICRLVKFHCLRQELFTSPLEQV